MFGRIYIFLIVLMIVADIGIFALFIRRLVRHPVLRILWFVPGLLLSGVYFYNSAGRFSDVFTIFLLAITLPKTIFILISLPDFAFRYFFKRKIYPFTMLASTISIGLVFIIIYGGTLGPTHFKVRKIGFVSPRLPEVFDGYKIVHVSDIHLRSWANNKSAITRLVEIINAQQPDAVMATGDLVHGSLSELDEFEGVLSTIKTSDGVYSVLGNHDYGSYRRRDNEDAKYRSLQTMKQRQEKIGWTLLNNEHAFLRRGKDSIALIGVENSGSPPFPNYGDLPKAMYGTDNHTFSILLSHDPTLWRREVLDTDIDLTLSGHTHAFQFALGRFSLASIVFPEWGGMYRDGNQGLYVNTGIGNVFVPFRFGAWPEITVITLRRQNAAIRD